MTDTILNKRPDDEASDNANKTTLPIIFLLDSDNYFQDMFTDIPPEDI